RGAGDLGGVLEDNCCKQLTAVQLHEWIEFRRVLRRSTRAVHCAALAFPPLRRFLTRRTCLLATGKNSAAPERTFRSALVSAEWQIGRASCREGERVIWAGHW